MTVDMTGALPTKESIQHVSQEWKHGMDYMDLFGVGLARLIGLPEDEFRAWRRLPREEFWRRWESRLEQAEVPTIEQRLEEFTTAGVQWSCLHNYDQETTTGVKPVPNEEFASLIHRYPNRLFGFGGVDPYKGMAAVRETERCVKDLGLKGVAITPFRLKVQTDDRILYPIYAKLAELGAAVLLHTGIHWARSVSLDVERPIYLDRVAGFFPELKIVAIHGGWPWVQEMVSIAWRHENVFIETSATRPKYLAAPGTGWDSLLQYGNNILQDKVLFGSEWNVLGMSVGQVIGEIRQLPLKEEVKEKWLHKNAARLFNLA